MTFTRFIVTAVALVGIAAFGVRGSLSAQQAKSQWDGVYTEEQATRGEALYSGYCASCHGAELTGGEMAPGLAGSDLLSTWAGQSLGDLFDRVRVSMPENSPGSLSRQQNADVLAYILFRGGYPAGETELPTQGQALNSIQILAAQPAADIQNLE